MDLFGEFEVRQPPVLHQGAQDRPVAVVDFVNSHIVSLFGE